MLDPKTFYRKIDSLLSKIGLEKSGKDFLITISNELEKTFGHDLKIGNGRIYQEDLSQYIIISGQDLTFRNFPEELSGDSEPIKALLKSKTYIFDNPNFTIDESFNASLSEYKIPAAIVVKSPEDKWILVFELKSGWIREEIEFCLNAVRTAINYRLFADAVNSEMKQAMQIQQSLLPAVAPQLENFDVAGFSQPAELVGGDLYDYFIFDNNVFGVCVGDASGHGLPAALLVRDVVTGLRMGLEKHMKMVYTFQKLNSVIYRSVYSTSFISLFYAEIERNGNILFVNAGHPSPILYDGKTFSELESTGLVFGALPEIDLHRGYSYMSVGSVLVLFSDGIMERKDRFEELFGTENIKKIVSDNYDKSSKEILDSIYSSALKFGNNSSWEDDATILVIKRTK